jgi:hypothetical protein
MKPGHTESGNSSEGNRMSAVLIILGVVLGVLCFVVLRSLVTNEDVDEE